jgi:ATP-binding cassette subfamily B protein
MRSFPIYMQPPKSKQCGAACLKMICEYYGKAIEFEELVKITRTKKNGTSLLNIYEAARTIGFEPIALKVTFKQLIEQKCYPCIAYIKEKHFLIITNASDTKVSVADPVLGKRRFYKNVFIKEWLSKKDRKGIILSFSL